MGMLLIVRGFVFDRNGLCRRQFLRLGIDQFLDLFCLAEQLLVDLRQTLLVLLELGFVGALIVERGVQAGQLADQKYLGAASRPAIFVFLYQNAKKATAAGPLVELEGLAATNSTTVESLAAARLAVGY